MRTTARPDQPPARLEDEEGAKLPNSSVTANARPVSLILTHAANIGPPYAAKLENQDATAGVSFQNMVAFAIADGVSTSVGAATAARLAVAEFCRLAQQPGMTLPAAANCIQVALGQCLSVLLEASDRELNEIAPDLPASTVRRLLKNTACPERRWPVALATTLVGCIVSPADCPGAALANVIVIGDGHIEIVTRNGELIPLVTIDPDITEIRSGLYPGEAGAATLREHRYLEVACHLNRGDTLLASSDGLLRGASRSISALLDRAGAGVATWLYGDPTWAECALQAVSAHLVSEYPARTDCADNLSLAVLGVRGPEEEHGVLS